jgi:gliding motility-associated protein GldL
MNISEIIQSKRWKVLMGYVYGWGAAIVLIGALFKLQHWAHSGIMLTIGLMTEAFIFFISAFEPPMELPDWTKVYPELREDYELTEGFEEDTEVGTGKLEQLLKSSDITPELLSKIGKSLTDLSNTASGISDISTATLATDMYVRNISSAAESMNTFSEISNQANENIHKSVSVLVGSYSETARKISETGDGMLSKLHESSTKFTKHIEESGSKLASSYEQFSNSLEKRFKDLEINSSVYSENIAQLNANLKSLNSTYEKQLKGTSEQLQASQKFFEDLNQMNQVIASSIQAMKKYQENAEKLNSHLEALNGIYGNMLGAMNYKKK